MSSSTGQSWTWGGFPRHLLNAGKGNNHPAVPAQGAGTRALDRVPTRFGHELGPAVSGQPVAVAGPPAGTGAVPVMSAPLASDNARTRPVLTAARAARWAPSARVPCSAV